MRERLAPMNSFSKLSLLISTGTLLLACSGAPASPSTNPTTNPTATPTSPPTASPTPTDSAAPAGLDGRTFLSVSLTDGGVDEPLVADSRIRLTFEDGNLGASAGCNQMGGTYTLDGDTLQVGMMSTTEMACDPPLMNQDQWLASFLGSGPTLTLTGNDLVLTSGDVVLTLLDEEEAAPDAELVTTVWVLDSIIDGDAVSSVPGDVFSTIEFAADGSVTVRPGCNNGMGNYTVDGNTITFGPIATTRMACGGDADVVEQAVLSVLGSGPLTFVIDGSRLTLQASASGLGYAAGS
jgi:heat shock protein HslJ